jgi:hypothetical protein
MSPIEQRYAEADAMAEWAQPAVLTMSTPALLAEVDAGLALRVCRQQTTARDVLLVQALTARLQAATISHALATRKVRLGAPERIELEPRGMLALDLPEAA